MTTGTISGSSVSFPTRIPRVLVVEDHADTLVLLTTILRVAGFEVVSAMDVGSALQLALDGFDAVCTDLNMPGRDGIELIREIRALRPDAIPIIVLSGQPPESVLTTLRDAGACCFLSKPCNPDELVGSLRLLLAECRRDCPLTNCCRGMRS